MGTPETPLAFRGRLHRVAARPAGSRAKLLGKKSKPLKNSQLFHSRPTTPGPARTGLGRSLANMAAPFGGGVE